MASAMRKMAVYLGLVEDDRYDDDYDEYDIYDDETADRRRVDRADDESSTAQATGAQDQVGDEHKAFVPERRTTLAESAVSDLARISTLHPRTYNEARTIG